MCLCRLLKQDVSTAQGVIAGDPNEPQQAMPFFTDELPQVRHIAKSHCKIRCGVVCYCHLSANLCIVAYPRNATARSVEFPQQAMPCTDELPPI
jgi:hypothetical protein